MPNDDTKRATFLVDESSYEEAKGKLDHGELSEELRQTVDRIAHGADVAQETRLTDRLQTLREDRRDAERKIREWQDERDELDRKIERVESRLDELREQDGEYDGVLAMLEADLADGVRVMEGTDKVKRAARIGDCTPAAVIDDLKERNPNTPDVAFRQARAGEPGNWKDAATDDEPSIDSLGGST